MWGGAVFLLVVYLCATLAAVILSASLFSRGLTSSSFLKGGGYWLIGAASGGLLAGALIGGLVSACVAGGLALGGGFMALFPSLLLLGKRYVAGSRCSCFGFAIRYVAGGGRFCDCW